MGRPRRITDEQIDDAARETFLEHGAAAPVSRIAEKLGVSHAAVLQRVGSKQRLLLRVARPGVPGIIASLEQPPPRTGRAARLEQLLLELLELHERILPGIVMLRSTGRSASSQAGEPPTLALRARLVRWLKRAGVPAARAAAVAEGLLGAIEARCFNAYLGGASFVAPDSRRFLRSLVAGLVPELLERKRP